MILCDGNGLARRDTIDPVKLAKQHTLCALIWTAAREGINLQWRIPRRAQASVQYISQTIPQPGPWH